MIITQEVRAIKKYRSEWKYCEEEAQLLSLKERLTAMLNYDSYAGENGKYEIHSLYFDDYKDTCARVNVAGEGKRFKYRIRYYGDRIEELADTAFDADRMNEILSEYQTFIEEPMRENDRRFFGDDSLFVFYEEMDDLKSFFSQRKEYLIPMLGKYK